MHTTNLRKVGGSVMLAVPPAMLDQLHLKAGATVGLAVDGEQLILKPHPKPRYNSGRTAGQMRSLKSSTRKIGGGSRLAQFTSGRA